MVPPLHRYYESLRLLATPPRLLRCPSLSGYWFFACSFVTLPGGYPPEGSLSLHARSRAWFSCIPHTGAAHSDPDATRPLTFPGYPHVHLPRSPTPAGPCHQALRWLDAAPAMATAKAPCDHHISRLYHAAFELAVYASRLRVTPKACKTRFRLPAKLYRVGFAYPQDSYKRFLSVSSRPPFLSIVTQRHPWRGVRVRHQRKPPSCLLPQGASS